MVRSMSATYGLWVLATGLWSEFWILPSSGQWPVPSLPVAALARRHPDRTVQSHALAVEVAVAAHFNRERCKLVRRAGPFRKRHGCIERSAHFVGQAAQ